MTDQPDALDELFAELRAKYAVTDEIPAGIVAEIHRRRRRSRRTKIAAALGVVAALIVVITSVAGGSHHPANVLRVGGAQTVTSTITIGSPPVVIFARPPKHAAPRLTAAEAFARYSPSWHPGHGLPGGDQAYLGSFSTRLGQARPGLAYGYRTPPYTCHRPPGVPAAASPGGQCARWTFLDADTAGLLLVITQQLNDGRSPAPSPDTGFVVGYIPPGFHPVVDDQAAPPPAIIKQQAFQTRGSRTTTHSLTVEVVRGDAAIDVATFAAENGHLHRTNIGDHVGAVGWNVTPHRGNGLHLAYAVIGDRIAVQVIEVAGRDASVLSDADLVRVAASVRLT